jgi:aspartate/methionine/tyrosine aminotransferase
MPHKALKQLVSIASEKDIYILSDEVYRPLYHNVDRDNSSIPPSITAFGYSKAIVTGSMSKAYALPGLRIGWIATTDTTVLRRCLDYRDYTTITVAQLGDTLAAYALSDAVRPKVLDRNVALAVRNASIVSEFVEKHCDVAKWVNPGGGTTAWIKFTKNGEAVDDEKLCQGLLDDFGVLISPGSSCFGRGVDFRGYVRLGYVCETGVLVKGLKAFSQYLETKL